MRNMKLLHCTNHMLYMRVCAPGVNSIFALQHTRFTRIGPRQTIVRRIAFVSAVNLL